MSKIVHFLINGDPKQAEALPAEGTGWDIKRGDLERN
jgi:hypothetical protein